MRTIRLLIASLVAVAMLAGGVAACTPEQVTQVEALPAAIVIGLVEILQLDFFLHIYGDPPWNPPATTPTTLAP